MTNAIYTQQTPQDPVKILTEQFLAVAGYDGPSAEETEAACTIVLSALLRVRGYLDTNPTALDEIRATLTDVRALIRCADKAGWCDDAASIQRSIEQARDRY